MKKLSVLFAALFVLASGQAFGFDRLNETSAQVYFSIPFGGPTEAEAMPRLGLSAGVGRDFVGYTGHDDDFATYGTTSAGTTLAFGGEPFTVSRKTFDFRLGIDGATSLYLNGSNVKEQLESLKLTDEELVEGWIVPLSVIAVGIMGFAVVKGVN
jgi:hypothetical protein